MLNIFSLLFHLSFMKHIVVCDKSLIFFFLLQVSCWKPLSVTLAHFRRWRTRYQLPQWLFRAQDGAGWASIRTVEDWGLLLVLTKTLCRALQVNLPQWIVVNRSILVVQVWIPTLSSRCHFSYALNKTLSEYTHTKKTSTYSQESSMYM